MTGIGLALIVLVVSAWLGCTSAGITEDGGSVSNQALRPIAGSKYVELIGHVQVNRNDLYRVTGVNIVVEEGKGFPVYLDENGMKLSRLLRSRIVKAVCELKSYNGRPCVVVHKFDIIGIAKKNGRPVPFTPAKVEPLAESKTEVKLVQKVEAKPEQKVEARGVQKAETNIPAKTVAVEPKPETNVEVKVAANVEKQPGPAVTVKAGTDLQMEQPSDGVVGTNLAVKVNTNLVEKAETNPATRVEPAVDTNAVSGEKVVTNSVPANTPAAVR
jgi:hypothetical protein